MQRLHRMPSISSYEASAEFYAKAKRWRDPRRYGSNQIGEPRKIDDAGKEYKSVRQVRDTRATNETAYAWRYHDTDVVTWLTEDHVIVVPWASLSTTSFMEALLPSGFSVNMVHPLGCMIGVDGQWFRVPENEPAHLHRTGDTWSVSPTLPIEFPQVNAKRAHAARREFDTAGLGAWLDAMFAMNPRITVRDAQAHALARCNDTAAGLAEDMHPNSDLGLQFIQDALRNPELYWAIMASPHLRPPQRHTRGGRPISRTHHDERQDWKSHMKHCALLAAYRAHDAVEVVLRDHVPTLESATVARRLGLKWGVDYHNWPTVE